MPSEEYAALCEQTEQDTQSLQVGFVPCFSLFYLTPTYPALFAFQGATPRSENESFLSDEDIPSKNRNATDNSIID